MSMKKYFVIITKPKSRGFLKESYYSNSMPTFTKSFTTALMFDTVEAAQSYIDQKVAEVESKLAAEIRERDAWIEALKRLPEIKDIGGLRELGVSLKNPYALSRVFSMNSSMIKSFEDNPQSPTYMPILRAKFDQEIQSKLTTNNNHTELCKKILNAYKTTLTVVEHELVLDFKEGFKVKKEWFTPTLDEIKRIRCAGCACSIPEVPHLRFATYYICRFCMESLSGELPPLTPEHIILKEMWEKSYFLHKLG